MADSPEQRYAGVVEALREAPGVTQGAPGRGFGASALKVHGKIFAMLTSRRQLVVKIPRERVDGLIASGAGERFDPGHGRIMKEWIALEPESSADWLALAREALDFVGSQG